MPRPLRYLEPTISPEHEVQGWVAELEQWAFIRERVLPKLDIRSARKARGLAAELRNALSEVEQARSVRNDIGTAEALRRVVRLRAEAISLFEADEVGDPSSSNKARSSTFVRGVPRSRSSR